MTTHSSRYELSAYSDGHYAIWELIDRDTRSRVRICPERGGIVTGCQLHHREMLYLDDATFRDRDANIRGGIPVLFPICGQLRGGAYEWNGQTYRMRNHGIARNRPWTVAASGIDGSAWLTLVLRSSADTLAEFPFAFELRFTYRLQDGSLTIEQEYRNDSPEPMPMSAGFHPYFATAGKNLPYVTDAARFLDYNDGVIKPFEGTVELEGLKESVALLDAVRPEIDFPLAADAMVKLSYSDAFRYVVLWSIEGKPFVCVEPWTALNEAMNDQKGLLSVAAGETLRLWLKIDCTIV